MRSGRKKSHRLVVWARPDDPPAEPGPSSARYRTSVPPCDRVRSHCHRRPMTRAHAPAAAPAVDNRSFPHPCEFDEIARFGGKRLCTNRAPKNTVERNGWIMADSGEQSRALACLRLQRNRCRTGFPQRCVLLVLLAAAGVALSVRAPRLVRCNDASLLHAVAWRPRWWRAGPYCRSVCRAAVPCVAEEVYQEGYTCYEQVWPSLSIYSRLHFPMFSGVLTSEGQEVAVSKGGCKGIVRGTSCADTTRSSQMQNEVSHGVSPVLGMDAARLPLSSS
jgi:hypothetical protein